MINLYSQMIQVYKFGGVSVQQAEAVKNVASIIEKAGTTPTVVVISAAGKSTNALEQVWERLIVADRKGALEALVQVKNYHEQIMRPLFDDSDDVYALVNDLFVEIEWVIEDDLHPDVDYIYDQIVSVGELISSRILAEYLTKAGQLVEWIDIRDVIRTDNTYRDAVVDWNYTRTAVAQKVKPLLDAGKKVIVQGFIGGTSENFTTTLGREGSDYTASVMANCLDADKLVIWKDVPGIMTADPRLFKEVTLLETLSYREAIEMTYYGAKVLHPKSIKPIQNKNIPLYVRSFLNPDKPGTKINTSPPSPLS
jgi:aspartate kinase